MANDFIFIIIYIQLPKYYSLSLHNAKLVEEGQLVSTLIQLKRIELVTTFCKFCEMKKPTIAAEFPMRASA